MPGGSAPGTAGAGRCARRCPGPRSDLGSRRGARATDSAGWRSPPGRDLHVPMLPGGSGGVPKPGYSAALSDPSSSRGEPSGAGGDRGGAVAPRLRRGVPVLGGARPHGPATGGAGVAPRAAARGAARWSCWSWTGSDGSSCKARRAAAPTLAEADGGPITSVAPTTTATALTSITTGLPPAEHGVVGYRLLVIRPRPPPPGRGPSRPGTAAWAPGRDGEVMDVLRWRIAAAGTCGRRLPAPQFQPTRPVRGRRSRWSPGRSSPPPGSPPRTCAGARLVGWSVPSTLVVEVRRLLAAGEPFVYAYYDGLDKVAHDLRPGRATTEAELRSVDRWWATCSTRCPPGAALVVTSDHGQVEVGRRPRLPGRGLLEHGRAAVGRGPVPLAARPPGRRRRRARRPPRSARRRGVGPHA